MKKLTVIVVVVLVLIGFATSHAEAKKPEIFARRGVAIKGADPVAYFVARNAIKGKKELTYEWKGATWRFVNAKNLEAFKADPNKYAPQYGGYCAWAVAENYTAGIDPDAWTIFNGKLYLNYSGGIGKKWSKDKQGNIKRANKNWPAVLDK